MSEEQGAVEQAFGSDSQMDSFFASGGENVPEDSSISEEAGVSDGAGEQQGQETESGQADGGQKEEASASGESDEGEGARQETAEEKRFRAMADSERIKRKELQRELEENRKELDRLRKSFETAFTKASKPEEKAPDFEDDPIGALRYENEQLRKQMKGLNEFSEETREQQKQKELDDHFQNEYRRQAHDFASTTPDFGAAYDYAIQAKFKEYKELGYSDQDSMRMVTMDERSIVAKAMQDERNPAEVIYRFAKLRGYNGSRKEASPDASKKIETIEKGAKIGRGISNASANPTESYRLEDIGDMSDDDFANIDWNRHVLRHG